MECFGRIYGYKTFKTPGNWPNREDPPRAAHREKVKIYIFLEIPGIIWNAYIHGIKRATRLTRLIPNCVLASLVPNKDEAVIQCVHSRFSAVSWVCIV